MSNLRKSILGVSLVALVALSACGGGNGSIGSGNIFGGSGKTGAKQDGLRHAPEKAQERETAWSLFANVDDPNTTVEVNKYIWNAALEVLDFMPVKAADPFTGIIVFDYGRPPGSGSSYKATVYVKDPALDARSLTVAMYTRGGPASASAMRQIEDAILTRARQLRVADSKL
ncbi:protein of unknown function [Aliiroseovarius crassostreae]|uniref:DUF3576 domain-containing protein n=1 Tax=Aliiroseovarius crassostreae TaxID=154981 RepID=A0A0P7KI95_9RHOB|nr:DUF3576 domain-containing protein [Aliiroseovarius crassostreae]KPN61631.1 hypothetical protein AKJ29_03205 [Aliiroseovarius crassostreae]SFU56185.1 protein of unknown function [Aliiroseovarius crassostreae]